MLILEREVELVEADGTVRPVTIRVFASPTAPAGCRFEIAWPGSVEDAEVFAASQRDAVALACRMIGARLALSDAHRDGRLRGLEKAAVRIFPVLPPAPPRLDA